MARTILIVDDEESILQSLDGILRDEGFDVVAAMSGAEALEGSGGTEGIPLD